MGTDYPEIRLAIHRGSAKSSTPPKLDAASKLVPSRGRDLVFFGAGGRFVVAVSLNPLSFCAISKGSEQVNRGSLASLNLPFRLALYTIASDNSHASFTRF
jgi:hypothetical protein